MHCIAGLGNPGKKYQHTRHNVGFHLVDLLAEDCRISLSSAKWDCEIGKGLLAGEEVLLVKPLTYMNRSGLAIARVIDFYKLSHQNLIVVHDDMDIPLGRIKLVLKGSSGGHNGVSSVIDSLHSNEFPRLKIGIGRPLAKQKPEEFVLTPFSDDEKILLNQALQKAKDAAYVVLERGMETAMNLFNVKKSESLLDLG